MDKLNHSYSLKIDFKKPKTTLVSFIKATSKTAVGTYWMMSLLCTGAHRHSERYCIIINIRYLLFPSSLFPFWGKAHCCWERGISRAYVCRTNPGQTVSIWTGPLPSGGWSPILPGLKPLEGFKAVFQLLPFYHKHAVYEVVSLPKLQLSFHTVSRLTNVMSLRSSG